MCSRPACHTGGVLTRFEWVLAGLLLGAAPMVSLGGGCVPAEDGVEVDTAPGDSPDDLPEFIPEAAFPEVMARHVCARRIDCECADVDAATCVEALTGVYEGQASEAQGAELEYDGRCVSLTLRYLGTRGCASSEAAIPCVDHCRVYRGTTPPALPCEGIGTGWDRCGAGLTCIAGQCVSGCRPLELGERCETPGGPLPCAPGLMCDPDTGSCGRQRPSGEICGADETCVSGICGNGQCEPAPRVGDPCVQGACAPDQRCADGVCTPAEPRVCGDTPFGTI